MEPEVIVMIASFLCGVVGMALAKSAKKKSSYPLIIASGFFAVLTFVGFIAAVILMFFIK